jgi:asparagine synthase (glutamine-hydrolysing)
MFAFTIWDSRRRILFAARDRLGIKPLYYCYTKDFLLFASEIKALLAHPQVRAELNRKVLPEYLAFGYMTGFETLFAGIQKLPPGHTLETDESGRLDVQSYWDVPQGNQSDGRPRSYYVQTYRELLEKSVESHLMSDVPLGVFLSGGIDSSLVAALMTKLTKNPVETFSVGYDEEEHSELSHAQTVADHLKSHHHEVRVSRQEFFNALPRLIWHEDEPLAWPGSVPLYFVARLAREHVKVVLTGEGSDETLGGYMRYPWTLWNARLGEPYRRLVPAALRRMIREAIANTEGLGAVASRRLGHSFFGRDVRSWSSLYFDNFYSAFSQDDQKQFLLDGEADTWESPYCRSMAFWDASKGDLVTRMLYSDIKTYLVELCMKQDQMSMAASIESRVPFLDHELVEFAARIPGHLKVHGLAGKLILKEGARGLLPESIIDRRKVGFSTPLGSWLFGPQLDGLEEMLLDARSLDRKLFRPAALKKMFGEHRTRQRDHTDQIWRLVNLELWQRIFMDRDSSLLRN